ncbi:diphthine--ammonia ligase [Candidatus Woesearchaeota archaeon]|nr:diphthine--ammonia ligase [Candidatus Woesearchaeota archaeon]
MKLASLFSGGKDSTFAIYLAKKQGHEIACLIAVHSKNPFSYMFHTPSIAKTEKQAKVMGMPLIKQKTAGKKEEELEDLKKAIIKAKKKYGIEGIVTGALASRYQASRVQRICDELKLEAVNPLWQKDQIQLLEELIANKFEVIVLAVSAYPLDASWLGRKIDRKFIEDTKLLQKKYGINPAGEGGEFETFVVNCPLFSRELKVKKKKITGSNHSYRMEISVE